MLKRVLDLSKVILEMILNIKNHALRSISGVRTKGPGFRVQGTEVKKYSKTIRHWKRKSRRKKQ